MRPHASIGLESANIRHSNRSAFTRAELVATIGALFLCATILLPSLAGTGSRSEQLGCLNNLRQIGIAFQAWGSDHDDQRPWFVLADDPLNQGGTGGHVLRNNAYIQFSALSNYVLPRVLSDPGEIAPNKRVAEDWSFSPEGGFMNSRFRDNALSYMLGLHTLVSEPAAVLTADRNVSFNYVAACAYGFTQVFGLELQPSLFRGWTNGNHGTFGNVLLNDGRVEFSHSERLRFLLGQRDDTSVSQHILAPFY